MKRILTFILFLCVGVCGANAQLFKKTLKITTSPTEAKIYIDGSYVADGFVEHKYSTKEGFVAIKVEYPGYITMETRIPTTAGIKARHFTLRPDFAYEYSTPSGNANKFFSVKVDEKLYSKTAEGKFDTELAWKMIHQVLLNYFDEIQTSDMLSGFVQTPWVYKTFPASENQVRTRVTVKESNLGGAPTFQIQISSEIGPLGTKTERFKEFDRILKDYESLISEFQSRLGK